MATCKLILTQALTAGAIVCRVGQERRSACTLFLMSPRQTVREVFPHTAFLNGIYSRARADKHGSCKTVQACHRCNRNQRSPIRILAGLCDGVSHAVRVC